MHSAHKAYLNNQSSEPLKRFAMNGEKKCNGPCGNCRINGGRLKLNRCNLMQTSVIYIFFYNARWRPFMAQDLSLSALWEQLMSWPSVRTKQALFKDGGAFSSLIRPEGISWSRSTGGITSSSKHKVLMHRFRFMKCMLQWRNWKFPWTLPAELLKERGPSISLLP